MKKKRAIEKVEQEYIKILELQARAAAEVGHRRRLARRSDVGQLRRRLPRAPDPEGVEEGRARSDDGPTTTRLDEASEPFKAAGEGGAQEVPRLLGQVPVLRRVLPRLRGVAREELQGRVPPRRRVPRSADAVNSGLDEKAPPLRIDGEPLERRSAPLRRKTATPKKKDETKAGGGKKGRRGEAEAAAKKRAGAHADRRKGESHHEDESIDSQRPRASCSPP